ncbi:uncharacterized protein LOC135826859 [Sycon ciliatum]|uniref:uncharacterized protein LOC135826859 n=1 Tax=Sycon ciliatum TaxID=27933 RepID=UPI0031F71BFA
MAHACEEPQDSVDTQRHEERTNHAPPSEDEDHVLVGLTLKRGFKNGRALLILTAGLSGVLLDESSRKLHFTRFPPPSQFLRAGEKHRFDITLRSSAPHSIHRCSLNSVWRIRLCDVRPCCTFEVPIILPEENFHISILVDQSVLTHVTLDPDAALSSDTVPLPSLDTEDKRRMVESTILAAGAGFQTQACQAVFLTSKDKPAEMAHRKSVDDTCSTTTSPGSRPAAAPEPRRSISACRPCTVVTNR